MSGAKAPMIGNSVPAVSIKPAEGDTAHFRPLVCPCGSKHMEQKFVSYVKYDPFDPPTLATATVSMLRCVHCGLFAALQQDDKGRPRWAWSKDGENPMTLEQEMEARRKNGQSPIAIE